jgi:murein DD-endopeptidase MepM/ murein hydrolase activator NlpD
VLGLLGNSGNSDAPHLHFQLMDANSPLGAEGIPYELATFTQLGVVTDLSEVLDPRGKGWQPEGKPVVHRQEFPEDNAVVSFRETRAAK